MTDGLDKFKRRMIRSVARLLLDEKKPDDQLWEELKKETGCDCKLLWQRMRALTMKKLSRLLAADDRTANIATVARLAQTDWLLFDLVLVHEQIDVIGRDKQGNQNQEHKPLTDLFALVQRWGMEDLPGGDTLADRWVAATVNYNQNGRYCSPMMLQRRWYQLKELSRANFYLLWHSYRGNQKLWVTAQKNAPSRLQMAIAKRYPHVITQPFLKWNELIEQRLVILPDEFENKLKAGNLTMPCDETEPDILLVEPVIETIELGGDSDGEDNTQSLRPGPKGKLSVSTPEGMNHDSNTTSMNVDLSLVKKEPETDGLSNVKILEATHVPDNEASNVKLEAGIDPRILSKQKRLRNVNNFLEATQSFVDDQDDDVTVSGVSGNQTVQPGTAMDPDDDDIIKEKADQFIKEKNQNVAMQSEAMDTDEIIKEMANNFMRATDNQIIQSADDFIQEKADNFCREKQKTVTIDHDVTDDIIREKADQFIREKHNQQSSADIIQEKADMYIRDTQKKMTAPVEVVSDDIIKEKADQFCKKKRYGSRPGPACKTRTPDEIIKEKAGYFFTQAIKKTMAETEVVLSNVEEIDFVDDIIKQKADEYIRKADKKTDLEDKEKEKEKDHLLDLANGMEFVDDGIEYVDDDDEGDASNSTHPETSTALQEEVKPITAPKFDLKLLMEPVIYTTKLDQMLVLKGKDFDSVEDSSLIESIFAQSKPESTQSIKIEIKPEEPDTQAQNNHENDDLFQKDPSEYESDSDVIDHLRVKPTSYLLQKPRSRSYNPIQLCKNPDFNTRLKRLNVGFFSSLRNRQLFKACKPMTIDLHKAFETKLLNGTLYLTQSDASQPIVAEESESEVAAVVPSAMVLQSLIDSTIADLIPPHDDNVHEAVERSKVINLPDISEIRRINQKLLTAEVPPLRVTNLPIVTHITHSSAANETNTFSEKLTNKNGETTDAGNISESFNTPVKLQPPALRVGDYLINTHVNTESASKVTGRPTNASKPKPRLPPKMSVQWYKPQTKPIPPYLDDFLITIDTLNKMINKINGEDLYVNPNKKNKKQNWVIETVPKDNETVDDSAKQNKNKIDPGAKKANQFCCWAMYRLNRLKAKGRTFKPHSCPDIQCHCCCKTRLASYLVKTKKKKPSKAPAAIVLSDDENDTLVNACASIETVVQQSANVPVPTVRVVAAPPLVSTVAISHTTTTNSLGKGLPSVCSVTSQSMSTKTYPAHRTPVFTPPTIFETLATLIEDMPPIFEINDTSCDVVEINDAPLETKDDVPTDVVESVTVATHFTTDTVTANTSSNAQPVSICSNIPGESQTRRRRGRPRGRPRSTISPGQIVCANYNSESPSNKMYVTRSRALGETPKVSTDTQIMDVPLLQNVSISPPAMRPKYIAISPKTKGGMDNLLRQIVLDGSKNCPIPRTVVRDIRKVLHVPMSKKSNESPIYLGKNKILLTTVKFPRNTTNVSELKPEDIQIPNVIPTLPLPTGVHLILLPDGELTFTVESGIELNDEQLSAMPTIIDAVQKQVNATPPQKIPKTLQNPAPLPPILSQDDVIRLNDDESTPSNDNDTNTSSVEGTSQGMPTESTEANELVNTSQEMETGSSEARAAAISETSKEISDATSAATINPADEQNICNDSAVTNSSSEIIIGMNDSVGTQHSVTQADEESSLNRNDNEVDTNKLSEHVDNSSTDNATNNMATGGSSRNLLSDLMEMSGISAEDTKFAPQPSVSSDTTIINDSEMSVAGTVLNIDTNTYTAPAVMNLPELSPVTSLSDLRYACAHNGKFFKLDFETGVIVPINVCIKRNVKSKSYKLESLRTCTIDLTDDIDATSEPETTVRQQTLQIKTYRNPRSLLLDNANESDITEQAKPVKLFRSLHKTNKAHSVAILNRKVNMSAPRGDIMKTYTKRKRKQALEKIEARIDLVDSDAPMEEEYLVDSSDSDHEYTITLDQFKSDKSSKLQTYNDKAIEDKDSSDDEPLATVAKRMRDNEEIGDEKVNEAEKDNVAPVNEDRSENIEEVPSAEPMETESETPIGPENIENQNETSAVDPESMEEENMEMETALFDFGNNAEESQEDCILGV